MCTPNDERNKNEIEQALLSSETMFLWDKFTASGSKDTRLVTLFWRNVPLWQVSALAESEIITYAFDTNIDYNFSLQQQIRFFHVAGSDQMRQIMEFIGCQTYRFDVNVRPEATDLAWMIECRVIIPIACTINGRIVGVLFFAQNGSLLDKTDCMCLDLVSCVFDEDCLQNVIGACFSRAVILAKRVAASLSWGVEKVDTYSHVRIWDIADCGRTIEYLRTKQIRPVRSEPSYLYIWNFVARSVKPSRLLWIA